jgi:hypothetical protein
MLWYGPRVVPVPTDGSLIVNLIFAWLRCHGILRVHWFAYWVTFVGYPAGPAAICVLFHSRVRTTDDVVELCDRVDAEIGCSNIARVLSWDRLPGDDVYLRDTRGWLKRPHRADTGSAGADLLEDLRRG